MSEVFFVARALRRADGQIDTEVYPFHARRDDGGFYHPPKVPTSKCPFVVPLFLADEFSFVDTVDNGAWQAIRRTKEDAVAAVVCEAKKEK